MSTLCTFTNKNWMAFILGDWVRNALLFYIWICMGGSVVENTLLKGGLHGWVQPMGAKGSGEGEGKFYPWWAAYYHP